MLLAAGESQLRRQRKCFSLPAKDNCAVSEMFLAANESQLRRQRNAKKAFRRRLLVRFDFVFSGLLAKVLFAGVGRLAAGQAEKACPAATCRLSRLLSLLRACVE